VALFFTSITFAKTSQGAEPHIVEGLYAFEKGDIETSERIFKRLLKDYPNDPALLYNMGNIKLVKKEYKLAAHYYQVVIDKKSELAPAAKIYMSQAVDALGNHKKAIRLLGEAIQVNISDSLYNLALDEIELYKEYEEKFLKMADHQFENREYERALDNYWLAWVLNPSSQTNFNLGHTLLLLNRLKDAEKYFYRIKDDELFQSAEELMYEYGILEDTPVTDYKRFSLYFDFSSGSNSNPNTESEGETYDSDSERVMAYGLDYGYFIKKKFTAKVGIDGYIDSYKSDPDIKSSGFGILLPVSYRAENYDLSFTPKRENTNYGGNPYVRNTSFALDHVYYFTSSKARASYTYTKYEGRSSDYDYLSGKGQVFEAYYTFILSWCDLTLGYLWGKERLNDSDSSISSNDNRALDLALFIPMGQKVSLDLNTNYQASDYLADSSDFSQKDKTWTSYLTLSFALKDYLTIYARERYIKNNSNVAGDSLDYNYTQQYFAVGSTLYLNF
jgi:hypothetical protein